MKQAFRTTMVATRGPGLHAFGDRVRQFVGESGIQEGLLTCFIRHTSASLLIQENADPDVLADMEDYMRRLVPRDGKYYRHNAEGPDDMPAHIRAALTATSLSIPIRDNEPQLGTWQEIYVFEHRDRGHRREVVLHLIGE